MKDIFIVLFSSLLAVEFFLRLPFKLRAEALLVVSQKSARIIISKKVSDHWKEIVLLRYAKDIMLHSMAIFLMLAGTLIVLFAPAYLWDTFFSATPPAAIFLSLPGQITATVSAVLYMLLRKFIVARKLKVERKIFGR